MKSNTFCNPCYVSKSHHFPYMDSSTLYTRPLELIHNDLWGPCHVVSCNGYFYYDMFIDHFTRFTWLYLLKSKSEVNVVFKSFKYHVENQFSNNIKVLQTDWGEYRSLSGFLQSKEIHHILSCPYTPQQNGLAERKHRHVVETSLSLLAQSSLATKYWDDAFATTTFFYSIEHLVDCFPVPPLVKSFTIINLIIPCLELLGVSFTHFFDLIIPTSSNSDQWQELLLATTPNTMVIEFFSQLEKCL